MFLAPKQDVIKHFFRALGHKRRIQHQLHRSRVYIPTYEIDRSILSQMDAPKKRKLLFSNQESEACPPDSPNRHSFDFDNEFSSGYFTFFLLGYLVTFAIVYFYKSENHRYFMKMFYPMGVFGLKEAVRANLDQPLKDLKEAYSFADHEVELTNIPEMVSRIRRKKFLEQEKEKEEKFEEKVQSVYQENERIQKAIEDLDL